MKSSPPDLLQIEKNGIATLLFCDAIGYAQFAAGVSPKQLIDQLSSYMKVVADTVKENQGTVAKFIGDAVLAYWLEENHADHAKLACQFASTIRERLSTASVNFNTRIGIHTGRIALVRINGGSYQSLEPMGDAVNLAAKLDGLCAQYNAHAIASEQVIKQCGGIAGWNSLGSVSVKGRTAPVTLYALL